MVRARLLFARSRNPCRWGRTSASRARQRSRLRSEAGDWWRAISERFLLKQCSAGPNLAALLKARVSMLRVRDKPMAVAARRLGGTTDSRHFHNSKFHSSRVSAERDVKTAVAWYRYRLQTWGMACAVPWSMAQTIIGYSPKGDETSLCHGTGIPRRSSQVEVCTLPTSRFRTASTSNDSTGQVGVTESAQGFPTVRQAA